MDSSALLLFDSRLPTPNSQGLLIGKLMHKEHVSINVLNEAEIPVHSLFKVAIILEISFNLSIGLIKPTHI